LRSPAGKLAARRPVRFERSERKVDDLFIAMETGHPQPNLLDWDRDGHTDLVVGEPYDWALFVARGPLDPDKTIVVTRFPLPEPPGLTGVQPEYFQFADWDGDGSTDLLVGVQQPSQRKDEPWHYAVYWLRNTAQGGEPNYAAPVKLLDIPAAWGLNAIAVDDSPGPGRQHLVVSVSKDWHRKADGGWSIVSQLWRYRR
jgi:hypothetical protein